MTSGIPNQMYELMEKYCCVSLSSWKRRKLKVDFEQAGTELILCLIS